MRVVSRTAVRCPYFLLHVGSVEGMGLTWPLPGVVDLPVGKVWTNNRYCVWYAHSLFYGKYDMLHGCNEELEGRME